MNWQPLASQRFSTCKLGALQLTKMLSGNVANNGNGWKTDWIVQKCSPWNRHMKGVRYTQIISALKAELLATLLQQIIHSPVPDIEGWKLPPYSQTFFFPLILRHVHRGTQCTKKCFPRQRQIFKVQGLNNKWFFLVTLWLEAVCIVLFWLFFIRSHQYYFSCQKMMLEKNIVSCEDDSIRKLKARERELSRCIPSSPALINMPWVGHDGRERQICSCLLCAPTSCSKHTKGRETWEKGEWLDDSCRAHTSTSISLAPVGQLPATHRLEEQLPWGLQSWGQQPSGMDSAHPPALPTRAGREGKQRPAGPWLTALLCVEQAGDSLSVPNGWCFMGILL